MIDRKEFFCAESENASIIFAKFYLPNQKIKKA